MAATAWGGVREGAQHMLGARRPLLFLSDLLRTHIEMIETYDRHSHLQESSPESHVEEQTGVQPRGFVTVTEGEGPPVRVPSGGMGGPASVAEKGATLHLNKLQDSVTDR